MALWFSACDPIETAIFAYCRGRLPEGFMPRVVEILLEHNGTSERANFGESGTIPLDLTPGEAFEVYRVMRLNPNVDQKLVDNVKLAVIEAVC